MLDAIKGLLEERRIKRLFTKPPKKASEKELVDFYNNEIVRVSGTDIVSCDLHQIRIGFPIIVLFCNLFHIPANFLVKYLGVDLRHGD